MAQIYERAAEMARLESVIAEKKRELLELEDDRAKLAHVTLPQLFDQVHTDRIGVPGWNADIEMVTYCHASITKEWPDERREEAFAELERVGGDDMIKITVAVPFSKKEFELAAEFLRYVRGWNRLGGHEVRVEKVVAWNTLTKFVEDLVRRKVPLDLAKIGAIVRRECAIAWRKTKS
jgi:hypothetical protein